MASTQHHSLLRIHCRICGQKKIGETNRGVQIKNHPQLCRWLRFLHDIEVERENDEIYPTRACDLCIAKLKNVSICHKNEQKKVCENVFELATKLHTEGQDDELRKLSRQFPAADFWAHSSSGMCSICDDTQKDSFPPTPDFQHLLIEVEQSGSGIFRILKFAKTQKPKKIEKEVLEVEAISEKRSSESSGNNSSNQITKSSATGISTGQAWLKFIEALGRNRRSRCDKLADLLKWSNTDNPKVLADLKASGLDYKIVPARHTTPNVEFKSTLAKCKRLLTVFPLGKRALMLFRAITDTVTDGRTDLMSHVGIFIDLSHPNMGFLKRKIQAKKEKQKQEMEKTKVERPTRSAATNANSTISRLAATSDIIIDELPPRPNILQKSKHPPSKTTKTKISLNKKEENPTIIPKLPSGITISKVKHSDTASKIIKQEPEKLLLDRPETVSEENPETITISQNKVKKVVAEIEKKHLPANRQMRTDVIFDCLHLRTDTPTLLADHGVIYNPKLGKHHLKVLSGQRKAHKTGICKATEGMNKFEWAAVMAQLIFGLLHTEDTLTLRVAGIMIDPFHSASPLSFRMGFMLKHLLISQDEPGLSRNLLSHILRSCEVDPQSQTNDRIIEDALIQLLYCERSDAKNLLASAKKPIKISLKSSVSQAVNKPKPASVQLKRKVIYKEEIDEPPTKTTHLSRRGRPMGLQRAPVVKSDDDDDIEYRPGVSTSAGSRRTRNSSSSTLVTSPLTPSRGPRGKYKKSLKQQQKEALKLQKEEMRNKRKQKFTPNVPWHPGPANLDSNVLVEVNADMLNDPLAVPENPLENVQVKTEVIEDEMPIMQGNSDPDPVSNLLISSVVSGNFHHMHHGMESPRSSSSLDIENNPIQDHFEASEENNEMEISQDPMITPDTESDPFKPANDEMQTGNEASKDPFEIETDLGTAPEVNNEASEDPFDAPQVQNEASKDPFEATNDLEQTSGAPTEVSKDPFEAPEVQNEVSEDPFDIEQAPEAPNEASETSDDPFGAPGSQSEASNDPFGPSGSQNEASQDPFQAPEAANEVNQDPFETSEPQNEAVGSQNSTDPFGASGSQNEAHRKPFEPETSQNEGHREPFVTETSQNETSSDPFEASNEPFEQNAIEYNENNGIRNKKLDDPLAALMDNDKPQTIHDSLNNGSSSELENPQNNGSQNDLNFVDELLQTNPLENGNDNQIQLDQDANDFFDQLIG